MNTKILVTFCFIALILPLALQAQKASMPDTQRPQAVSERNLIQMTPHESFENILVKRLDSDEQASTFLIWVKESVKEHFHAEHSETVYIVDGRGTMTLGEDEFPISAGDYIFIPKGTHHSVRVDQGSILKAVSIQAPHFDGSDRIFVDE